MGLGLGVGCSSLCGGDMLVCVVCVCGGGGGGGGAAVCVGVICWFA